VRALVTGATGKIGHGVVMALLDRGDSVRALVRDARRAARLLPEHVDLVVGDVTNNGCPMMGPSGGSTPKGLKPWFGRRPVRVCDESSIPARSTSSMPSLEECSTNRESR
jgi:nucleoside-diphosphate-sugar epimerase